MRRSSNHSLRRGVQILESILVICLLAILTAAMVQYGAIETVQQAVEAAAQEGAREAAKEFVTATIDEQIVDAAEEAVTEVLSVHQLAVADQDGSGVRVIVNDSNGVLGSRGDALLSPTQVFPAPAVNEYQVIVLVSLDPSGVNPDPIPNLLDTVGIDFTGEQYEFSATAKKE